MQISSKSVSPYSEITLSETREEFSSNRRANDRLEPQLHMQPRLHQSLCKMMIIPELDCLISYADFMV
jgi:hypothetical protein